MDNFTMDNSTVESLTIPSQLYIPNSVIEILRSAPSMGRNEEFALLVSVDPSDRSEYTSGLMLLGYLFLVFFFIWTLVVLMFKCMGPEKVGFWSGHAMQPIEVQPKSIIRRYKILLVRSVVCKAALVWMAFVIVFLTVGLNGLDEAKTLFKEGFNELNIVIDAAAAAQAELQFQTDEAIVMRDNVVSDMTRFCSLQNSDSRKGNNESSSIPFSIGARRTARMTISARQATADEETASKLDSLFAKLATESATTDARTPTPSPVRSASNRPESDAHDANTNQPIGLNLSFLADAPVANVNGANTDKPITDLNLGVLADVPVADVDGENTDQPVLDLSFFSVTDAPGANLDGTNTDQQLDLGFISDTDQPVANLGGGDADQPVFNTTFNFPSESNQASPISNNSVATELNQTLDLSFFGDSLGLFVNSTEAFANAIGLSPFAGDETLKALILDALFSLMILDDFIAAELEEGMNAINATLDLAEKLNATAESVNPPNTLAYVLAIPWLLTPSIFFIFAVMAWRSRPNAKMLPRISRYAMPLLCLLTIASAILAVIMLAYATANADFCSGGQSKTPDETVLEMVMAKGFEPDSLVVLATDYYVSQCEAEYPYAFLDTFKRELESASLALAAVEAAIATKTMESVVAECGSDAEGIDSLLSAMNSRLLDVGSAVEDAESSLSCDSVVPTFTSTAYDTACDVSVNGLYYSYVSFIVMAFTGMIMITLRTAFVPVEGQHQTRDAKGNLKGRAIEDMETGNLDQSDEDVDFSESESDSEEGEDKGIDSDLRGDEESDPDKHAASEKDDGSDKDEDSDDDDDSDEDESSDDDEDSDNDEDLKDERESDKDEDASSDDDTDNADSEDEKSDEDNSDEPGERKNIEDSDKEEGSQEAEDSDSDDSDNDTGKEIGDKGDSEDGKDSDNDQDSDDDEDSEKDDGSEKDGDSDDTGSSDDDKDSSKDDSKKAQDSDEEKDSSKNDSDDEEDTDEEEGSSDTEDSDTDKDSDKDDGSEASEKDDRSEDDGDSDNKKSSDQDESSDDNTDSDDERDSDKDSKEKEDSDDDKDLDKNDHSEGVSDHDTDDDSGGNNDQDSEMDDGSEKDEDSGKPSDQAETSDDDEDSDEEDSRKAQDSDKDEESSIENESGDEEDSDKEAVSKDKADSDGDKDSDNDDDASEKDEDSEKSSDQDEGSDEDSDNEVDSKNAENSAKGEGSSRDDDSDDEEDSDKEEISQGKTDSDADTDSDKNDDSDDSEKDDGSEEDGDLDKNKKSEP